MNGAAVVSLSDYRRQRQTSERPQHVEARNEPPAWAPERVRQLTGRELTHRARMLKFLADETQRALGLKRV